MVAKGGNDSGTWVLLAVMLGALYLVYRSIQNIGTSITSAQTSTEQYVDGIGATLAQEGSNVMSIPSNLYNGLGNVGSTLYSGGSSLFSNLFGTSSLPTLSSTDPFAGADALDSSLFGLDPVSSSSGYLSGADSLDASLFGNTTLGSSASDSSLGLPSFLTSSGMQLQVPYSGPVNTITSGGVTTYSDPNADISFPGSQASSSGSAYVNGDGFLPDSNQ